MACTRAEAGASLVLEAGCLLLLNLLYQGSVKLDREATTDHTHLLCLSEAT